MDSARSTSAASTGAASGSPSAHEQTARQARTAALVDPVEVGEVGVERLPTSKLDLIDAGHFAWEDAPEEYAEIVTSWWAGGHARA
jgi:hypothetical protein